jgi:ParB family chromosome partitioning protein
MSNINTESTNKKRLGRGLGSLLGASSGSNIDFNESRPSDPVRGSLAEKKPFAPLGAQAFAAPKSQEIEVAPDSRIWNIAIEKIKPSSFQPRSHFEKDKLEELASSIKEHGILQPIVVRKASTAGSYEIIAGERRWRAAQIAGLHEVPVIFKALEDQSALELAIIENIQREDLNPIEEAEAYQRLADEFNLTQEKIAQKVGKDRATIANLLRLLQLPLKVRDMVASGQLSQGHAKLLTGINNIEKCLELAHQAQKSQLSVRALEKLVQGVKNQKNTGAVAALEFDSSKLVKPLSEELQKALSTKVNISYSEGKGKIEIHFYSDDELNDLVDAIKAAKQK